uniref:Uncharacterized protein n=1 Tax=Anguilla anguilla TaxID=7936 RepID=A0A0E9PKF0_ANGAN
MTYSDGILIAERQSEGCRFDPRPGRVKVSLSKTPNP